MQHIQWFPGHMMKAKRMMEENMKLCDGAIYVLDARAVFGCVNNDLIKIFNNKPVLYLINKSDLIDQVALKSITECFKNKGFNYLVTVGSNAKDAKVIASAVNNLLREKIENREKKGVNKALRFMVCGVPNTGKSTIINNLSGKRAAQTGDKAGVTKGKQWIKLENLELLDTPGTMPPNFDNQEYAHHLAYIGSVNDDILDIETLCLEFIEEMERKYPNVIKNKYGAEGVKPLEIFDSICMKRGYIMRGNEPDYARCSKAVIDDFRKGKLGKLCLELSGKL